MLAVRFTVVLALGGVSDWARTGVAKLRSAGLPNQAATTAITAPVAAHLMDIGHSPG